MRYTVTHCCSLIYVNELSKIVSSIKLFGDDTKMWRKIQNREDIEALQHDFYIDKLM